MKKSFRILPVLVGMVVLFSSAGCVSPPVSPDQLQYPALNFQIPETDTRILANGIRLYFKEDKELPLVQITAMIGAGAINTPKEKTGFEGLFGTTWRTGGAGERSPKELDDYLDMMAADLGAQMGPYSSKLNMSLRAEDLDKGLAILADMLRRPGFSGEKLELARLQAQESVRRQNDNPGSISRRLLMQALYPDNYLGYSPTHETLAAISREDLFEFQKTFFAPNKLWIAVSGDFDPDKLLKLLNDHFGDWQQRQVPMQELPHASRPESSSVLAADKNIPQTTIVIGDLGLTKDNPDQYAVKVMNYILGGGGFNSRLMREIRSNRGLAYSAYSYFQIGRRLPGPFVAGTETKSESVVPAIVLAREIMTDMRDNRISEAELKLAKESLINSYVFGFENSHSVINRQMDHAFYGFPEDYMSRYQDRIAAVTIDDVQRVSRKYINLDRQQMILVGDLDHFRTELEQAGLVMTEVDLDVSP